MRDESPMIAGQKPEALLGLAEGESDSFDSPSLASEDQMVEMASYVNNRNHIIAGMAMLLFVSVITNVILLVVH
jgi:serine/threonine-protein kinase